MATVLQFVSMFYKIQLGNINLTVLLSLYEITKTNKNVSRRLYQLCMITQICHNGGVGRRNEQHTNPDESIPNFFSLFSSLATHAWGTF